MRKLTIGASLIVGLCLTAFGSWLNAQGHAESTKSRHPFACLYLSAESEISKDDPAEERDYDASVREFYRLWCTEARSSIRAREDAADFMTERWKKLWYRDDPFNAEFHETGSFGLLVLIGITHKIPKPLATDSTFMHDWLADCSDRCFMIYGDDDPGAKEEWKKMLRLRKDLMVHLEGDAGAKPVMTMLKNAKLYPVN